LASTLPPAPAGLAGLSTLLHTSGQPLQRATQVLDAIPPAVPAVLQITDALSPVLDPVMRMMALATPTLQTAGRYGCDIKNFAATMRSMTGFTQPGADGPAGPPQAFRLQAIIPLSTDVFGVKDSTGELTRDAVSPPCRYPPTPYTQLSSLAGGLG
jgi:hypothetical protein